MKLNTAAVLMIAIGTIAVEADAAPIAKPAECRPHAAAALEGRAPPSDATIRHRTRSATVRRIAPGDMVTQDYREDRVTVTIANGKVAAASCG